VVTLGQLKQTPEVRHYLDRADEVMASIGYTEHGRRHANVASKRARSVLEALERPQRQCELAAIAAYLHDIGNLANRDHHAQSGAVLAHHILLHAGMPVEEVIEVVTAIGHHHETDGAPVSDIAAALIVADKSDVHRSRVRTKAMIELDIHDRVNYAVTHSSLVVVGPRAAKEMGGEREGVGRGEESSAVTEPAVTVVSQAGNPGKPGNPGSPEKPSVTLALTIDVSISPVMEYFEIFLPRMILSNKAAEQLGAVYKLVINDTHLL
jgi:hypothetical protein